MKRMPRRRTELRKELEALGASARKKLGEARWQPILGLSPDALIQGRRYVGWICKGCSKRLEQAETTQETPEPERESFMPWVQCHCGRVLRYRWNARTIEMYRGDRGVAT
jgi:hypothetical protein